MKPLANAPDGPTSRPALRDARGQVYEPAVGPRLKVLLFIIFGAAAALGATGAYLLAIDILEKAQSRTFTNQFTLWVFLCHVLAGVLVVVPFLFFGFTHLATARRRKNRRAVRLGIALFLCSILAGLTGIALIQLEASFTVFGWQWRLPQLPTGTTARWLTYNLHALAPVAAVALYVLHRRAGPEIQWRWGIAWGLSVAVFVAIMAGMHSQDPRHWYARGSPEGEKYFEPAKTRTVDGNFIPQAALLMDSYCLKCHADNYAGWFHSAHHFSSFNNPPYLFSVRETRKGSLARDGEVRASRWCAGCHDPVPFLSGQFDNPSFDDVNHPTAHAGITCTVCHAMVNVNSRIGNGDYTIEEPLHYPFAYSAVGILQWLNNQLVKAKPDFHKKTFIKDFHRSEKFCSTCHKVSLPMALNHYKEFLRGQNHSDTFLLSGVSGHGARSFYYPAEAKNKCADCHMPLATSMDFGSRDFDGSGIRKVHNHFFPAANTGLLALLGQDPMRKASAAGFEKAEKAEADFLRGAGPQGQEPIVRIDIFGLRNGGGVDGTLAAPLRPELPALQPGQSYLVEVVLRTLGLGHPFTQGTTDSNEVWVEFTARSAGRLLGQSGAMDGGADSGRVDEWAHFVNVLMLDRHGNRIDRRNPQDIFTPLYDHQIPPGAAQVVHYLLKVPPDASAPVELAARLRYRKFDYTYLEKVYGQGKVPVLPIVDLCADRVVLPIAGKPSEVAAQASPIQPAWQRWNDYGIGCLLEGGVDAKQGELRQAEDAFRRLTTDPAPGAHAHGYLNLARVFNAQGRLDEAAYVLNRARTAQPPAPWWTVAWFTGLVNAQNGHLDEAITNFEQILDPARQPRSRSFDFTLDYVVIDELGKTFFLRSQLEHDGLGRRVYYLGKAVEQFEKTLTIDPEDLMAHYWLAQCYPRIGQPLAPSPDTPHALNIEVPQLLRWADVLASPARSAAERTQAAAHLAANLPAFGTLPASPKSPRLPVLDAIREKCRPVYRQNKDMELGKAAALVLGQVHRLTHAIYKPDDNSRDQVMAIYRERHPAASHASQAIVIYPLGKPEDVTQKK
jgi:tetratricopeptide (TPR) repeat protein